MDQVFARSEISPYGYYLYLEFCCHALTISNLTLILDVMIGNIIPTCSVHVFFMFIHKYILDKILY